MRIQNEMLFAGQEEQKGNTADSGAFKFKFQD